MPTNHCSRCNQAGSWPIVSKKWGPLCNRCYQKLERSGRLEPEPREGVSAGPCERCGFKHSPDEPEETCTFMLREALAAAEEDVTRAEAEAAKRDKALAEMEGRITILETRLREQDGLIQVLRTEAAAPHARDEEMERLRARVSALEGDNRNLKEAKERALEKQRGELEGLRRRADELRVQLTKQREQAAEFMRLMGRRCRCDGCTNNNFCEEGKKTMDKGIAVALDLFGEEGFVQMLTSIPRKHMDKQVIEAIKALRGRVSAAGAEGDRMKMMGGGGGLKGGGG